MADAVTGRRSTQKLSENFRKCRSVFITLTPQLSSAWLFDPTKKGWGDMIGLGLDGGVDGIVSRLNLFFSLQPFFWTGTRTPAPKGQHATWRGRG